MRPNIRSLTEAMPQYWAEKKARQASLLAIAERKNQQEKDLDMLAWLIILICLSVTVLVLAFQQVRA